MVDPALPTGSFSMAATLGYGFTEPQPGSSGSHHRGSGELAAGIAATPWLAASLSLRGRYDLHPNTSAGRDDGWVFDPKLALRAGGALGSLALGGELAGTLSGSESLATSFRAPSLDARLLLGSMGGPVVFGSFAGFRLDRSSAAGTHASQLSPGDRLAIGLSDYNAVLLGVGAGARLGSTLLFAETSGDLLVGRGAPPLGQSPLRAGAGVRRPLSSAFSLEGLCDVALSARPIVTPTAPLIPIEPRVSVLLGLRYRFGEVAETRTAPLPLPPPPAPPTAEAPAPEDTDIEVAVTDDQGVPEKEAKVEVVSGEKRIELHPDEKGRYRASHVPLGRAKLSVRAEGKKPVERDIDLQARAPLRVDVHTEAALPSGQVRGLVRSFDGKPVAAKVTVEPGGQQARTDGEGFFQIDVPPGKYQVLIEAKGYAAQRRSIEVEKNGVLILNADLARGR